MQMEKRIKPWVLFNLYLKGSESIVKHLAQTLEDVMLTTPDDTPQAETGEYEKYNEDKDKDKNNDKESNGNMEHNNDKENNSDNDNEDKNDDDNSQATTRKHRIRASMSSVLQTTSKWKWWNSLACECFWRVY